MGTPPLLVTLHLGPLKVSSTYTTVGSTSMSGLLSVLRSGEQEDANAGGTVQGARAPPVHSWQVPNIRAPRDDRRNSRQEIRTFSSRVREIWPYLKKATRVTVRVNGLPLPIYGHGMFLNPPRTGDRSLDDLRNKLDNG